MELEEYREITNLTRNQLIDELIRLKFDVKEPIVKSGDIPWT